MRTFMYLLVAGALALAAACSGRSGGKASSGDAAAGSDTLVCEADTLDGLAIPRVPSKITAQAAVAGYAILHYWDNMDFGDTARTCDDTFMERHFGRYLSAFPYAGPEEARMSVERLMRRAQADTVSYCRVLEVAERFLTSPNSVMRNEELYSLFLEAATEGRFLDRARMVRVEAQMADVRKNRRGTAATDFAIEGRDGSRTTLYGEAREGQLRLVVFYDPECEHCHEIMGMLGESEGLAAAVAEGAVRAMAVYADGDRKVWACDDTPVPAGWLCGISPGGEVADGELYALPAMPVIYLLAPDNTVLLKDATVDELFGWFEAQGF